MISKSYMMQKELYPLTIDKTKSKGITSPSFNSLPPTNSAFKNNSNHSEPLNHNSKELSFKGFSHIKPPNEIKVTDAIKKFGEIFGESAKKHLKGKIDSAAAYHGSGLEIKNDRISFAHRSVGKKIVDILLYPIVKMPLDIANSFLKTLKKIPVFKESKTIDKWLSGPVLKERSDFVKNTSDIAAIEHYFELLGQKTKKEIDPKTQKEIEVLMSDEAKNKELFDTAHTRFKPLLSNYDTTTERTVTRIVTGMIPAFYLANDAYNLSMYMKNDKNDAEKDKKRRFNQEAVRIGITAAFTFVTMSLFTKKTNESKAFATILSAGVVLVSETVGRLISGTPILPVGEKHSKKYAEIQDKMYSEKEDKDKKSDSTDTFKGFEGKSQSKEYKKPPEKGNLTIKNALKVMGVLALAGLGIEKTSNIKSVKKVLDETNGKYKNFLKKEFKISRKDFDRLTQKLKDQGFEEIANRYEKIVANQKGDNISLGKEKDKTKDILVHQILAFPVRFVWDTLMMPYKSILKPVLTAITGSKAPVKAEDLSKKEMDRLRDSIQFLTKIDKDPKYQEKVNKSILSSLDNVTKSSYSNSDLAAMTKIATSGVTSAFLISDNYNQVMIESKGKNKELAEQKAKERTLQRAIRIVYGAFIIKLFNGIFAVPYNRSLLGAQVVNIGNTGVIEALERKSVGLPIGESTREEIIKEEKENLHAKGFKGKYFRFMAKLTGKKSLSESAVVKEKNDKKEKLKKAA